MTPVGPVGPVAPVAPVRPVAPVAPVTPTVPVAPVGPVEPVDPVTPVDPVGPAAPPSVKTTLNIAAWLVVRLSLLSSHTEVLGLATAALTINPLLITSLVSHPFAWVVMSMVTNCPAVVT